jgi:hypothetical protein
MTTVARRIIALPSRSATATWEVIAALLAPDDQHDDGITSDARRVLDTIAGIACSLIADEVLADAPLIVSGAGPRLRVYCLYGDDALIGEEANEALLAFTATTGDWQLSLPCPAVDLSWVQRTLATLGESVAHHVSIRDSSAPVEASAAAATEADAAAEVSDASSARDATWSTRSTQEPRATQSKPPTSAVNPEEYFRS